MELQGWYNKSMRLLHFTAEWCSPCKAMKPVIDEYIENHPDVEYKMIDIDYDFDSLTTYDVLGVPTFILLNDNEEIRRHTGAMPKQDFQEFMVG
jgi:thioredoxin 1